MPTPRAGRRLEHTEGLTAQPDDELDVAVSVICGADVLARRHVRLASAPAPGAHWSAHPVPYRLGVHGGAVLVLTARDPLCLEAPREPVRLGAG